MYPYAEGAGEPSGPRCGISGVPWEPNLEEVAADHDGLCGLDAASVHKEGSLAESTAAQHMAGGSSSTDAHVVDHVDGMARRGEDVAVRADDLACSIQERISLPPDCGMENDFEALIALLGRCSPLQASSTWSAAVGVHSDVSAQCCSPCRSHC